MRWQVRQPGARDDSAPSECIDVEENSVLLTVDFFHPQSGLAIRRKRFKAVCLRMAEHPGNGDFGTKESSRKNKTLTVC